MTLYSDSLAETSPPAKTPDPPRPYRAPIWLPGGHLQTIYPATLTRRANIKYRRERWPTPDGDFVDVDFVDGEPAKPLLVLFHGMEGSSNSHYARAIMAHIAGLGWSGAIPHFRSCSGEINHAPRFYHCADHIEANWLLRQLQAPSGLSKSGGGAATNPSPRPVYAVGVSLGGSVLLQWLAQSGESAATLVHAAASVCAPLDVKAGGHALARKANWLYTQQFLKTLKPKALAKLSQHPGLFDAEALKRCRTIHEFDHIVTAPLHGFESVDAYYAAATVKPLLKDIKVPTLILNTLNDPFIPAGSLPDPAALRGNAAIKLQYLETGGHLGFTQGLPPGNHTWLPQQLTHWLSQAI